MPPDGVGYLRITAFWGYTDDGDYDHGAQALEAALNTILPEVDPQRGLVIDIRVNTGGNDGWALAVANHLTDHTYLAYRKEVRTDPQDASRWGVPQRVMVRPSRGSRFLGRVALLTGINSVSAAETFAMALMGRTPHVVRVGEPTQGVFSDVLERRLPNGWRFGLPNERYLTKEGIAYDVVGVPPDNLVPVFPKDDLERGRDGALEQALSLLRQRRDP